jgi:hypothetical protein
VPDFKTCLEVTEKTSKLFKLKICQVLVAHSCNPSHLRKQRSEGSRLGEERGEVGQIMYTHVSKCKNDKIKFKINKLLQHKKKRIKVQSQPEEIVHKTLF